jgi:hypothetical protein
VNRYDTAECYSGTATAPGPSDYYRANTRGSLNFQRTTGPIVKAAIDPTRFESFTAAPTRPKAGQPVTVAGELQREASGWQALPQHTVQIIFQAKGSKTWTVLRRVTTGSNGGFSAKVRIYVNGLLSARYLGNASSLQCSAPQIRIHIRK